MTLSLLSSCSTLNRPTGYRVIVTEMPKLRAVIEDDGETVRMGHLDFVDIMEWAFKNDLEVRAACIANGQTIQECTLED